jgi:hypothetical protein
MRGGEACNRNAEWRARDVVETHLVAESYRPGLSTMLAANANLQLRSDASSILDGDANQPANSDSVENLERIIGKDAAIQVRWQKASSVVAAQSVCSLRQIVSAE